MSGNKGKLQSKKAKFIKRKTSQTTLIKNPQTSGSKRSKHLTNTAPKATSTVTFAQIPAHSEEASGPETMQMFTFELCAEVVNESGQL